MYLESLLTYGNDAAESHLRMAYWELDEGDFMPGDCSKPAEQSNTGFCARLNHVKKSQEVHMYGLLHADICNVPQLLVNGVKIQIKLTKAKPEFYLLGSKENWKVYFKVLEAVLYVKRIRPSPTVIAAHNETLLEGYPIRYKFTKIELNTFTFSADSQSLAIDNAVLGRLPKRLIFTMVKNADFLGTMFTKNPPLWNIALYLKDQAFIILTQGFRQVCQIYKRIFHARL